MPYAPQGEKGFNDDDDDDDDDSAYVTAKNKHGLFNMPSEQQKCQTQLL